MSDFLVPGEDDHIRGSLVGVYRFETESEREAYIKLRGWFLDPFDQF